MNDLTEFDLLYVPSHWSNRGDIEGVLKNHVDFVTKGNLNFNFNLFYKFIKIPVESEKVRQNVPCELNVPYGDLEEEKFDLYGTDLPASKKKSTYLISLTIE